MGWNNHKIWPLIIFISVLVQSGKTWLCFDDINGGKNCFRLLVKQQRDIVSDVSYLHPCTPVKLARRVSNHVILLIHVQSWCFMLLFPNWWFLFPLLPRFTLVQLHGKESFCWSKRGEASRKISALITPPNQVCKKCNQYSTFPCHVDWNNCCTND